MKKALIVLLIAICLCSDVYADQYLPISTDDFANMYDIVDEIYGAPALGEMKIDYTIAYTRYWETEHEKISVMLDLDKKIKTMKVTADLSSRAFLNVCFCALQAMHIRSFTKEDKGLIIEHYFMTNLMPEGYWSLNDQVMYQFVFSETGNVMNVYVN